MFLLVPAQPGSPGQTVAVYIHNSIDALWETALPRKDVRIVGSLEGAFQLFQLIATECRPVSPLL